MRTTIKKANISLIMLFVLGIGSVIGLMSTSFVQDMLNSSKQLREFYGSYYIAKGGVELGNLMINRYEHGFEDSISGNNALIQDNLNCNGKPCDVSLAITSRLKNNTNGLLYFNQHFEQSDSPIGIEQKFSLLSGESIVFPLFMDERSYGSNINQLNDISNPLGDENYNLSIRKDHSTYQESARGRTIGIGITLGSASQAQYDAQASDKKQPLYMTGNTGDGFNPDTLLDNTTSIDGTETQSIRSAFQRDFHHEKDHYNYLYLTNLDQRKLTFVVQLQPSSFIVPSQSTVSALAHYGSTDLGLQAIIKKPLLEYIVRPHSE